MATAAAGYAGGAGTKVRFDFLSRTDSSPPPPRSHGHGSSHSSLLTTPLTPHHAAAAAAAKQRLDVSELQGQCLSR